MGESLVDEVEQNVGESLVDEVCILDKVCKTCMTYFPDHHQSYTCMHVGAGCVHEQGHSCVPGTTLREYR